MKANYLSTIPSKMRKALMQEVNKQTGEAVGKMALHISSLVLWSLHQQLGFGKKRLLRFQKQFLPLIEQLQDYYELQNADETEFVILRKLKDEVGLDVAEHDQMFTIKCHLKE